MKFTKEMVNIIESRFKIKLLDEEINKGEIFIEWNNGFGSIKEIYINRRSSYVVYITANFKGDGYKYINSTVDNKFFKKLLQKV